METTATTLVPGAAAPADSSETQREQRAIDVVNRYTAWAAAAGVIPVPLVDMVALGSLQVRLVRRLAEIYGVAFSENIGKSVVVSLVGTIVPAAAAPATAIGIASALKFVPVVGMA